MNTLRAALSGMSNGEQFAVAGLYERIDIASQCGEPNNRLSADIYAAEAVRQVFPDASLDNGQVFVSYPPFSSKSTRVPLDVALLQLCDGILEHQQHSTLETALGIVQWDREGLLQLGAATVRVAGIVQENLLGAVNE